MSGERVVYSKTHAANARKASWSEMDHIRRSLAHMAAGRSDWKDYMHHTSFDILDAASSEKDNPGRLIDLLLIS
jgi:hypothetical protein